MKLTLLILLLALGAVLKIFGAGPTLIGVVGLVYLAGYSALIYAAIAAPEGYQDSRGFHLGRPTNPVQQHSQGPAPEQREPAA